MKRKIILTLFLTFFNCISFLSAQEITFDKKDRILILAPHPDDEAIGCAGIIQEALSAGAKIKITYLTNGDHNQVAFIVYDKRLVMRRGEFIHMGQVRKSEAIKAMKLLGLSENDLIFLGYPDFGTFNIFSKFWQAKKPFKSILTRISNVPYKENFSYGAPYAGESILGDLKKVLLDYKPNKIFVSHPADVNVDHKSFYLFLEVALADLTDKIPQPKIYPYLIHCVDWPLPRHYHPELNLEPPRKFLNTQIGWLKFELTPEQLNKKYQAILCYKSQTESSAFYLLAFARKNELFGDYSEIDLDKQVSLKEKPVSFFGFSGMFASSDVGSMPDLDLIEKKEGGVSYAVVDKSLLIRIEKPTTRKSKFTTHIYLFGYSYRTSFTDMPKIRIITKFDKFKIFDANKIIKPEGVFMDSSPTVAILHIPLQILGNPDFILTSLKAFEGALPVDATGFRKIDIK
jgi:LmbE family N-acetylglucosaminyl deacetylase